MNYKQIFYPESKFGGLTDIDGTMAFYTRVNALIESHFVVLDVGCGRGHYGEDLITIRKNIRILKGKAKTVIGIDVDKAAEKNPFLDAFYLLTSDRWPLIDNSVDLIICDYVLEHVENPENFFSEIHRILKNSGYLCIRTPNSWGYVAIASRIVPNRHHFRVLEKVQDNRKEEDVFPTYYRCNSIPKLRAILAKYSSEHTVYGYEAEPSYLSFSRFAYWLGVWIRFSNILRCVYCTLYH
jgi:SAM-dependent methyltransferase